MVEIATRKETVCPHGTMSVCGGEGSQVGKNLALLIFNELARPAATPFGPEQG